MIKDLYYQFILKLFLILKKNLVFWAFIDSTFNINLLSNNIGSV